MVIINAKLPVTTIWGVINVCAPEWFGPLSCWTYMTRTPAGGGVPPDAALKAAATEMLDVLVANVIDGAKEVVALYTPYWKHAGSGLITSAERMSQLIFACEPDEQEAVEVLLSL
jgi:hypothetical protein